MWKPLPPAVPDAIFRIAGEARAAGPKAIDGTIGMYLDEEGSPFLFPSVANAVKDVAAEMAERAYGYMPLTGLQAFRESVHALLPVPDGMRLASIAATGGTGAVALNLRMLRLMDPATTVILPVPAWINHPRLCAHTPLALAEVPFIENGRPSPAGIVEGLRKAKGPVAVILQAGCHNPTGLDFSPADWLAIRDAMAEREAVALIDLAYQGFSGRPEEDAAPIRVLADAGIPTLVCWSASKNHSLYSERVGLAAAVVPDEAAAKNTENHYGTLIRGMHSGSALTGQAIVARTQQAYGEEWRKDMKTARETLTRKRRLLKDALPSSMHAAMDGHGMFAMLPLSKARVETLRTDHLVFLADGGRLNIAGIPEKRVTELGEKIAAAAR